MSLVDYLYVDHRRLDSYVEQIGSPVTYDKVPVWSAGISLTGPKAEGTQQRFARPLTTHERVRMLLDHLTGTRFLSDVRPYSEPIDEHGRQRIHEQHRYGSYFVLETWSAVRMIIPATTSRTADFHGLGLWISEGQIAGRALLCLLEDYSRPDSDRPTILHLSAYSL
jgi:hypothetical protein